MAAENWIALGSIATALVVLSNIAILIIIPWYRRPKFSIQYSAREPFCRQTLSYKLGRSDTAVQTYWTRLRIINSGKSLAGHCLGKLTKVLDENGRENEGFDPIQLHWVGTNWDDVPFRSVDLNRGDYEYLDVVVTQSNDKEAHFAGDQLPWAEYQERQILDHVPPGKYILGITVYGNDVKPETKYLSLIWRGDDIRHMGVELHNSLGKAKSWLKKRELTSAIGQPEVTTPGREPGVNGVRKDILFQAPTYASIGFILAIYDIPAGWGKVAGFIFLIWALLLFLDAYNVKLVCKIMRPIEPALEFPSWNFALVVLAVGFMITLADILTEGIAMLWFYAFCALGFVLLLFLGGYPSYIYARKILKRNRPA